MPAPVKLASALIPPWDNSVQAKHRSEALSRSKPAVPALIISLNPSSQPPAGPLSAGLRNQGPFRLLGNDLVSHLAD